MKKEILLVLCFILGINITSIALNNEKRSLEINRVSVAPKIDGVIDDIAWKNASVAKDFIQFKPYNGKDPSLPTEVKVVYDDQAIYFAAIMYDNNPDSIFKDLGERDIFTGINSDIFAILISPYNDGVNAVEFMVSASGIQSDAKHNGNHSDGNWDGVWESEVKITEFGWVVEMKIPYSALRFSKANEQTWGIHFFRNIRRFREWSTWNFIDINTRGFVNQMGDMTGAKNIEPPLRLSVTPYVSTYLENNTEGNKWGNKFNAGMDLKWGINQSFTLDMILIPDFGQVQSDDEILNLSPYEIRYNEKR
ncbi:MAG: carbohydrate binding family 9 domain-containing protein, partial [Bacteroidales bacterium]|nr:carbohydrate binding family 9 domain-containing protein [Bacteroidales bacterium]